MSSQLKIGLALGSGSARGMSHIGIIHALADMNITPTVVCGTSAGALVGASYVSGNLDKLEVWARSLTKMDTARFFDINMAMNGFVNERKLQTFLMDNVADKDSVIEDCEKTFAAVATGLENGREIWLSRGPVNQAVLASMAYPGLFPAIRIDDRWLIDGGLVNPVPVSVCRAMGADIIIAVNLNGDLMGRRKSVSKKETVPSDTMGGKLSMLAKNYTGAIFNSDDKKVATPGLMETLAGSINITQDRITRSRMAGDPPEILISPKLSHIGLLELYRAEEAIAEGIKCVEKARELIEDVIDC